MIETTDGGYMLAGSRENDAPYLTTTDIYLIKTDEDGNQLWTSIIGYDSISETPGSVCQTTDGGYAVCGSYWAASQTVFDVFIIKTNSMGLQEWRQVYSFEDGMAEHALHIIETEDGGLLVTGDTQAFSGDYTYNAYLMKTNSLGDVVWLNTYGDPWPWYESAYQVIPTSDGGFFICGQQNNDGLNKNWYVVKTDGNGNFTWSNNAVGGTYHDGAYAACETLDGNYAVTGTYHQDVWNSFIAKYSIEGDTLWTKMWGYEGLNQYNYAIQQLSDGGYITVGSTTTDYEELKIFLTRLSPDVVGISDIYQSSDTKEARLFNCQPNPFNQITRIPFHLKSSRHVTITIHNLLGVEIYKLVDDLLPQGDHTINFDGSGLNGGLYLCRISSGSCYDVVKLNKVH
jgi:hypothetical protein